MSQTIEIQEIAIAVTAKGFNPVALNPDFLKYSNIVPDDWDVARPPVYSNSLVQLVFKNGIGIIAQPNRIIFAEAIAAKSLEDVGAPDLAIRYIEKLPNMDYQAVGINPRGYVSFGLADGAHQYLFDTLLSSGDWQRFGVEPAKAALQMAYTLERGQLNLSINEAKLKLPEDQAVTAALFSANFDYKISGEAQEERLSDLKQLIGNWQADIATYKSLINEKFLLSSQASVPEIVISA